MITRIYWGDIQEKDYFFGTRYRKEGTRIFFDNPLMPATMVIHRWSSRRPYQANRRPVDLPLLKRGKRYHLRKHMTVLKGNPLYLKLLFYDRYDDLVSQVFIKEEVGSFTYPEDAYRYEIELVNTACQQFCFDYLTLEDLSATDSLTPSFPNPSTPLTVIFQEDLADALPETVLEHFGNVLVISPDRQTGDFVSDQRLPMIETLIRDHLDHYQQARLIAYGPYGGLAVVYLTFFLEKTTGYHLGIDQQALMNTPFTFGCYLDDVLSRQYFGQNLINYQTADDIPFALFPQGNDVAIRQLFYLQQML